MIRFFRGFTGLSLQIGEVGRGVEFDHVDRETLFGGSRDLGAALGDAPLEGEEAHGLDAAAPRVHFPHEDEGAGARPGVGRERRHLRPRIFGAAADRREKRILVVGLYGEEAHFLVVEGVLHGRGGPHARLDRSGKRGFPLDERAARKPERGEKKGKKKRKTSHSEVLHGRCPSFFG